MNTRDKNLTPSFNSTDRDRCPLGQKYLTTNIPGNAKNRGEFNMYSCVLVLLKDHENKMSQTTKLLS